MRTFTWQCPFCLHNAVVTDKNFSSARHDFNHGNSEGWQTVRTEATICPNPTCKLYELRVSLHDKVSQDGAWIDLPAKRNWRLIPDASVKPFPPYVPRAIIADYREACLIREGSPKASATLARRCLQGMIRDFWRIKKARLVDEIEAIKGDVDPLTWQAIDAIRQIGNIGAHMEKDINIIVDVEPEEATLLIGLIETLIHEWYVVRHERAERLNKIISTSASKQAERSVGQNSPPGSGAVQN